MSSRSRPGCLITFEGTEGAGKSTQMSRLAATLRQRGYEVTTTFEPGATTLGKDLRRLLMHQTAAPPTPFAELLLYLADRAQHIDEIIQPAIAAGVVVLCDRFSGSTIAYQGYGRDLGVDMVVQLDAAVRRGLEPALTIWLDCTVEEGLNRAVGDDRLHREALDFHRRVRDGFRQLADRNPAWVTVPVCESREETARLVLAAVDRAKVLPPCDSPTS